MTAQNKPSKEDEAITEFEKDCNDYKISQFADIREKQAARNLIHRTEQKTASKIVAEAENFQCCPLCGGQHNTPHFCPVKEERYVEEDDAYWFAEYLKKKHLEQKVKL